MLRDLSLGIADLKRLLALEKERRTDKNGNLREKADLNRIEKIRLKYKIPARKIGMRPKPIEMSAETNRIVKKELKRNFLTNMLMKNIFER